MLTIDNIDRLRWKRVGEWYIDKVEAAPKGRWLMVPHYCITFHRDGEGGALFIERNKNRLLKQYHLHVCWNSYDNVVWEGSLGRGSLEKRDEILSLAIMILNQEWDKRK